MARAVVLLSGGLDSATCLAWARREGWEAHALTVDYGQRHAIEVERAVEIARRLGAASHRIVTIDLSLLSGSALTDRSVEVPKEPTEGIPVTYVPARNALFLSLALGWAESLGARDLVVGVNAVDYSGYPDCRPPFLRAFEAMAREGTKAGVEGVPWRVHAPLVDLPKVEIVRRALAWGVPIDRTVSCYDPDGAGRPCGRCDACRLRDAALAEANAERS
jgi:7-cyano-7-deazaguanine synthase